MDDNAPAGTKDTLEWMHELSRSLKNLKECIRNNVCVRCGREAKIFDRQLPEVMFYEYGLCQDCQNDFIREPLI